MGLRVVQHLQAVLEPPQEVVGLLQLVDSHLRGSSRSPASRGSTVSSEGSRSAPSWPPRTSWNACTMNSISRMPPAPSLMLPARSRRCTSRLISAFISRSDSNTPKSR